MTMNNTESALAPAQAAKLWNDLRGHFANAERIIIEIIETKAWEPLGFASFTEAWTSKMAGIPLATDAMRAHVVYMMFNDGMDDAQVLASVGIGSRIGPTVVTRLREQHEIGVPANLASTRVRSHVRKLPSRARTLHIHLTSNDYDSFRDKAAAMNVDPGALGKQIIREWMGSR